MDNPNNSPRRLHPLIAVAAGAVIVASLVATAAVTGLFPKALSNGEQSDQVQSAAVAQQQQPVVDTAQPANLSAQQQAAAAPRHRSVSGEFRGGAPLARPAT